MYLSASGSDCATQGYFAIDVIRLSFVKLPLGSESSLLSSNWHGSEAIGTNLDLSDRHTTLKSWQNEAL